MCSGFLKHLFVPWHFHSRHFKTLSPSWHWNVQKVAMAICNFTCEITNYRWIFAPKLRSNSSPMILVDKFHSLNCHNNMVLLSRHLASVASVSAWVLTFAQWLEWKRLLCRLVDTRRTPVPFFSIGWYSLSIISVLYSGNIDFRHFRLGIDQIIHSSS